MRHVGNARPGKNVSASRKKQHGKVYSSPNRPSSQGGDSEAHQEIERWLAWGEAPWTAFRSEAEKGA